MPILIVPPIPIVHKLMMMVMMVMMVMVMMMLMMVMLATRYQPLKKTKWAYSCLRNRFDQADSLSSHHIWLLGEEA
jgi:hypothetical protein